jgi:hypothetical protein
LRFIRVKQKLEFSFIRDEELIKALEGVKLTHSKQILVSFSPFQIVQPSSWVLHDVDISLRSSKQESKLNRVYQVVALQDLNYHREREE